MREPSTLAVEQFDRAFDHWLTSFLRARNLPSLMPRQIAAFRQQFDARIPVHLRELIGTGLRTGVLTTKRGFLISLECDDRPSACQYVFNGTVGPNPCWE